MYKNLNLRQATILDLTQDWKILEGQFGLSENPKNPGTCLPVEYTMNLSIQTRIKDFLDYAELTHNKELEAEVFREFKNELDMFGFE